MELPNEVTRKNNAILGLTWAFLWRIIVLAIILGIIIKFIPEHVKQELGIIYSLLNILSVLALYWIATHWLLQRGFGSTKIILMEHVDYQNLIKKIDTDESL